MEKAFFGHQPQMVISTIYAMLEDDASSLTDVISSEPFICVYPNPIVNTLSIDFGSELEKVDACIYDSTGKLVKQTNALHSRFMSIDFSALHTGVYFLKVDNGEEVFTKRVVK